MMQEPAITVAAPILVNHETFPIEDKALLLKNASITFANEIRNELTLPKAFVRKMV